MFTPGWTTWLVYRKECVKTTWTLRLSMVGSCVILMSLTRGFWIPGIAHSLVCNEEIERADAILVENFDPDYLLFERAEALDEDGVAPRVFVPVNASAEDEESRVEKGIADVMAGVARLEKPETIPVREVEPISLNAAYQIREAFKKEHVRSVVIVTPGFRSRRSSLVYRAVLGRAGIVVYCVPVFGTTTPETWLDTWHGVQSVTEQFLKLQYYRFYVLPVHAWKQRTAGAVDPGVT